MPNGEYKDFIDMKEITEGDIEVSGAIESINDNVVTINATKVGSFAMSGMDKFYFTAEVLENYTSSWTNGKVTLNHKIDDAGIILASWYEEPYAKMRVQVDNPETLARLDESTGVSVEAFVKHDADYNITEFKGTGISFIFYPDQPCCKQGEGCGVIASENGGTLMTEETVSKAEFDDLQAKYIEASTKIAEYEAGEEVKAFETKIADMQRQIDTLTAEIETRDAVVAASLVQEIQALDDTFEAGEMNLDTLKAVHASVTKIAKTQAEKAKTEVVETSQVEVAASCEFEAPVKAEKKTKSLRIGGWNSEGGKMNWIND
jgi:hypothetical protein